MAVGYDRCRAKVLVLYTGGTMGMLPAEPGNSASPLRPGQAVEVLGMLQSCMPGLGESAGIYWELQSIPGQEPYDSSDIRAEHWIRIAAFLESEYSRWDGFVVVHGTDTMAYTASGLSFLLENLAKPVVLTGSQLPMFHERSDARGNLVNALHIAGYKAARLPCVPEVVICFGHVLLRGNRARKVSTADLNGFESPNFPPLGRLGEQIHIDSQVLRRVPDSIREPFYALRDLSTDVMDITLFPGMQSEHLDALLGSPTLKGLLVRTFGAGNVMNDAGVIGALSAAAARGVAILNITQCLRGNVEMGLYENSSALLEMGVAAGSDMTPEAGLAKMMWALATVPERDVQARLQVNLRGEQSTDVFDIRYDWDGPRPAARVTCAKAPSGQFRKSNLDRAVLRISGVAFEQAGRPFELRVFLGQQHHTDALDRSSIFLAGVFEGIATAHEQTFVKDVTEKLAQFIEDGYDVPIVVHSATGSKFSFRELRLLLSARSWEGRS